MDDQRFDRWVRGAFGTTTRRASIKALAGAAFGALALPGDVAAAATCRPPGKSCQRDKDCCTHWCRKGGPNPRCACSRIMGACRRDSDCCRKDLDLVCRDNGGGFVNCCHLPGTSCRGTAECCGNAVCQNGTCV